MSDDRYRSVAAAPEMNFHSDAGAGQPKTVIVTGPCQSGKSTLLSAFVRLLREKGMKVAGIIAVGLWRNNRRTGFDLLDISDGRKVPLCRRTADGISIDGLPFAFDQAGLMAGYEALSVGRCTGADVVIVDEVGVLELRGRGWSERLSPMLALDGPVHVWVVRESCLEEVRRRWGLGGAEVVSIEGVGALERLVAACETQAAGKARVLGQKV